MNKKVALRKDKEFITLSQLLKCEGFVSSGGEVHYFLNNNHVTVDGVQELRRGKKLYVGNHVVIDDVTIEIVGA